jgi:hypothetical protein
MEQVTNFNLAVNLTEHKLIYKINLKGLIIYAEKSDANYLKNVSNSQS